MPLSDDQKVLLRILAQREEGYGDIAALKGLSVEEVRAEVKAALDELEAAGAAPPPPASQIEEPPGEPPPRRDEAKAEPPPASLATGSGPPAKAAPSRRSIPAERRRLLALTGGALGVVAIVLIAIAAFSDGSDSGSDGSSGSSAEAASSESKVTQAALEPVDGSAASGRAIFGRVGKKEIVLQVTAEDLQPTDKDESYTIWLYRSPELALRVGGVPVGKAGRLAARFPIPPEVLAYVANGTFSKITVSRTSFTTYAREAVRAKKNKFLPRYNGKTVLSGEITGPVAKGS